MAKNRRQAKRKNAATAGVYRKFPQLRGQIRPDHPFVAGFRSIQWNQPDSMGPLVLSMARETDVGLMMVHLVGTRDRGLNSVSGTLLEPDQMEVSWGLTVRAKLAQAFPGIRFEEIREIDSIRAGRADRSRSLAGCFFFNHRYSWVNGRGKARALPPTTSQILEPDSREGESR